MRPWPQALAASLVAIALIAGGCTSDRIHEYHAHTDKVTSGAGNAMAANTAVHTIDPWPDNSRNTQINIDGKRAETAIDRYETNANRKSKAGNGNSSTTNGTTNGSQKD